MLTLYFELYSNIIYFLAHVMLALAIRGSIIWLLCPSDIIHPHDFASRALPCFMALQGARGSFYMFPTPAPE